jgi:hypothetical protein
MEPECETLLTLAFVLSERRCEPTKAVTSVVSFSDIHFDYLLYGHLNSPAV